MTDFGLGDDIVNEDKREAALALHFGTDYLKPKKPKKPKPNSSAVKDDEAAEKGKGKV